MSNEDPLAFLEGFEERLLTPAKPKPKPQSKLSIVGTGEPPVEALRSNVSRAQERLYEAEKEVAFNWRRNFKRYGRARPIPAADRRAQDLQDGLDAAMHRIRYNQMMERFYRRELDPYKLGLYGPTSDLGD
jgi:hypothetical protein